MRFATLCLAFLGLASSAYAAQDGWQPLFDGKTMAGWNDPSKKSPPGDAWRIEDGCLKAVAGAKFSEDLVSNERFGDFELEFDWKISSGGNSGFKYRIQEFAVLNESAVPASIQRFEDTVEFALRNGLTRRDRLKPGEKGQEYVVAFEYQLIDDDRHADALRGGKQQTGALYDLIPASKKAARPAGEFNGARIVLRGNHVEHWLNGTKVLDASLDAAEIKAGLAKRWGEGSKVYELLTRQPRKACPISLQNHQSDTWFRNIRVRRLP